MKPKVIAIVGPTASGKSALGLWLAQKLQGEIICMDSMQIYQGFTIGTAKPTPEEQRTVPHHLLDIAKPGETYTVAQYAADATRLIQEIHQRSKMPFLIGGTGFYLQALTQGLHLGGVRSDPQVRKRLQDIAKDAAGKQRLHAMLQKADPETAAKLHYNDVTRVSRALEVLELTGIPLSKQAQPVYESPFEYCILGTTMERKKLYERINWRVDSMISAGLLDEVKAQLAAGVSVQAQAMQGIGYKELVPVITLGYPLNNAVDAIKQNSRHYAKRQFTWFRRNQDIQWLDMEDPDLQRKALQIAQTFLEGKKS